MYEANEKKKFRQVLANKVGMLEGDKSQATDFVNQLNQVYLKEHVEHTSIRNNAEFPIYKIAITGGPCAGKSTSLDRIKK